MMPTMTKEEILHLAGLARIRLTNDEIESLKTDLTQILDYVGVVTEIAGEDPDLEPKAGAVHNVLREDKITNEPGSLTDDLIKEMPDTKGQFLKVKKILHTEE